jgi:hypothetical protein
MKTIKFFLYFLVMSMTLTLVTSCDDEEELPPIGGYNSADEVGAANLLAYWPLNGDGKESKTGTAPSKTVGATWVDGSPKGKALKLTAGFLDYPTIAGFNNFSGSVSVSCWAKITNTKKVKDGVSNISPLFSLSGGPNGNIGNLSLFGNTHGLTTDDSIQMKAEYHFKKPDGSEFGGDCVNMTKKESWMDDSHSWDANKIGGKWAHIVWVWDGATANTRLYVNGKKISNKAWESRNNNVPMPFSLFTPSHPIIGATPSVAAGTNVDTWNAALTGEVDEIRVWNKLLPDSDIGFLYDLEKAGR